MRLSERQRIVLRALAKEGECHPGRIANAIPGNQVGGRRELGARNTLDALERKGLVASRYNGRHATGRDYRITDEGLMVLQRRADV